MTEGSNDEPETLYEVLTVIERQWADPNFYENEVNLTSPIDEHAEAVLIIRARDREVDLSISPDGKKIVGKKKR